MRRERHGVSSRAIICKVCRSPPFCSRVGAIIRQAMYSYVCSEEALTAGSEATGSHRGSAGASERLPTSVP
jgi:hypothetical protein